MNRSLSPIRAAVPNVIERQYAPLQQSRGRVARYDECTIIYRPAERLTTGVTWLKLVSDTPWARPAP